ncbi:leucine-rich repeat domain-containing protein [Rickettsia hoogstraalii]|uniref:hypothetical protein n=1 Tax=Rickettsia hoogstraalii TaxID=467174 RepID=UPI000694F4B1|nr:hypothetical protein [Rickettsia hoogstraalii]
MFKGWWFQTSEEATVIKTPNEKLIEFLEKRGLTWQADSLRKGGTTLKIFYYKIGDAGAIALAASLKDNKSLTSLNLEVNKIGDAGASYLAASLKDNKSLTSLNLGSNKICDAGARELTASLKANNSLTSLDLKGSNICDAGARELAASLKDNKSLTLLSLLKNNIGKETLDIILGTITEYLQRNQTIAEKKAESLNAEGNNLCSQKKYNEAIEKYKAAIKIMKSLYKENKLYEENKAKAEKKYEEQQELEKRRVEEEQRKQLKVKAKKQVEEQKQLENNKLNKILNKLFHNSNSINICFQTISDELAKLIANKLRSIETIAAINFFR